MALSETGAFVETKVAFGYDNIEQFHFEPQTV